MISKIESSKREKIPLEDNDYHKYLTDKLGKNFNALEIASGSSDSVCEAFINRATGRTIIEALVYANLKFNKEFEAFLTNEKSSFTNRSGGPYTQISRILAKILWSGDLEKIKTIFVDLNRQQPSLENLKLWAEYPNQDEATCALQSILMQLLDKDEYAHQTSDVVVSSDTISLNEGACFDVTSYYCQALEYGELHLVTINGKLFLAKTHGNHTLINLSPLWFNGIDLPKGSLFRIINEDEFVFLRLTPFMFDNWDDMLSAFGSEVIKARDLGGDPLAVLNYRLSEFST